MIFKISVIIPVFNNSGTLPSVLRALLGQKKNGDYEIIFVDNGSKDASFKIIEQAARVNGSCIKVAREEKRGAAAARNKGAKLASSPIILFLGGDIIPQPGLLSNHLSVHELYPENHTGCLGLVTWDPAISPTPFMVYLEHGGPQNAFGEIAGTNFVDPEKYFYGSNISLKKETFMDSGGFADGAFSEYGWEDLELGVRLKKKGFQLYYEPEAKGYHHHRVSFLEVEERMVSVGRMYAVLKNMHPHVAGPDLERENKRYFWRKAVFTPWVVSALRVLALFFEQRKITPWLYGRLLSLAYYKGVHLATQSMKKGVDKSEYVINWKKDE